MTVKGTAAVEEIDNECLQDADWDVARDLNTSPEEVERT